LIVGLTLPDTLLVDMKRWCSMQTVIIDPREIGTFVGNVLVKDASGEAEGVGKGVFLYAASPGKRIELCILPVEAYNEENATKVKKLLTEVIHVGYPEWNEDEYTDADRASSEFGEAEQGDVE
jgi:hypothetical protein